MSFANRSIQDLAHLLNADFGAGVEPDSTGALHLLLESGRSVHLAPSPDGRDMVFTTVLRVLDRPRDVLVFAAALACNLHQEQTCGGAIALDAANQQLVFSWRLSGENMNATTLLVALGNYCDTADRLAHTLEQTDDEFPIREREHAERRALRDAAINGAEPFRT